MLTTYRCIFLQIIFYCLRPIYVSAEVTINNYFVQNQICNHTVIDTTLTNSVSYIGNFQENLFEIQTKLDDRSYRLSKEIITIVSFNNISHKDQQLKFYSTRYRFIKVGALKKIVGNNIYIEESKMINCNKQFLSAEFPVQSKLLFVLIMQPISFKDYYSSKNIIYRYESIYQLPELDLRTEKESIGFCVLMLLMLGIIFILFIFYGLAYFSLKENIYAIYSIYLLFTFIQVIYMYQYTFAKNFILFNYLGNSLVDEGTKGIMVVIYGIFLINTLNLKQHSSIAYYSIYLLILISIVYVVVMVFSYATKSSYYFEPSYFLLYRIPLFVLSLITTIAALFIKNKTNFQKLILTGALLYIFFAIFSFMQDVYFTYNNMFITIHGLYLGVALELILFSIALATKVRDTYKESEKLKDVYITELKAKEEFISNENIILEERVRERVAEIKQQNILIDEQKRNAMIHQFEKEKVEIQMQALSSQMNPHFIFNCMNSIQHSIFTNDTEKASTMLHDFASLIRMVLENSSQPDITLEHEIKLLETYLKLEQLRTNNSFDYTILVSKEISADFIKIPTMMLQPFLENAIWHGFKFVNYKGKIDIEFTMSQNLISCKILDNGIGIKKSEELNKNKDVRKSMAIQIIKNRIFLINKTSNKNYASINITDLSDENLNLNGTQIIIDLPIS